MSPYRVGLGPAPDLLICAGLDPSGGAGLIADTRVAAELGARPVGVVTALTVQNTTGVIGCTACDPEIVDHQLSFLLTDIEVKAVKIGMIGSTAVAKTIAKQLELTGAPVVWDPILYPSRGDVALVDMVQEITKAQLLCLRLGRLKEADKLQPGQVSLTKRNNVAMARDIARDARDILGANGVTDEYQCGRHMLNLESVYTYEGTNEVHTLILGNALTGHNAF